MDSSFLLTGIHVALGLYALIAFIKMCVQFGLPNHPVRFTTYLVSLCVVVYFVGLAAADLQLISPWDFMKWRPLPLVAGSLCLLLQVVTVIGSFSLIQQKIIGRIPLIGALICFAFFPSKADFFVGALLLAGNLFLIISVGKARYQKRLFLKMSFFLFMTYIFKAYGIYGIYIGAEALFFVALFYFFLFEQSFGISALMDDFKQFSEGDVE